MCAGWGVTMAGGACITRGSVCGRGACMAGACMVGGTAPGRGEGGNYAWQ